jgi:restriction system protein
MASQYPYRETIRNNYLGVSKEICARTLDELNWRVWNQQAKWSAQAEKKRQTEAARQEVADLRLRAERQTEESKRRIEAVRSVLTEGIKAVAAVQWPHLRDHRAPPGPPTFEFEQAKPDLDRIRADILGPIPTEAGIRCDFGVPDERPFVEMVLPFLRSKRLRLEDQANDEFRRLTARYRAGEKQVIVKYNEMARDYNASRKAAKSDFTMRLHEHEHEKQVFLDEQEKHNAAVAKFQGDYEGGVPDAVERLVQMALDRSTYPDSISGDPEVLFDEPSRSLVVNFWLPHTSDLPSTEEYKFVASRKEIRPVEMKRADFQALYDDVVHQIALRSIHEVLVCDYRFHIQAVVFNGWVRGVNPQTGKEFTSCILSCQAPRQKFAEIDLKHVSPKECVRGLRGITAGPLAELAPVRPIMNIDRDDDRFIEAKAVMEYLDPRNNLAAMDWEDFEHLVRELFARVFEKDGCEVRVTQASRDRGVDAMVVDNDPIRGGKIVIQAKRYNIVVPVSAVRELYGTMMNEGATKGILVTTSYFGHDSREFAKGKPISLIDGSNLLHMFQEHGKSLHITLAPRGERPGIGRKLRAETAKDAGQ